jgi:hypothetical protein
MTMFRHWCFYVPIFTCVPGFASAPISIVPTFPVPISAVSTFGNFLVVGVPTLGVFPEVCVLTL